MKYIFNYKSNDPKYYPTIYIEFIGEPLNKDTNELKDRKYLDQILKNSGVTDLETMVKYVRTVFKNYNETYLDVGINYILKGFSVEYKNREMINYEHDFCKNDTQIFIRYNDIHGINIKSKSHSTDKFDYLILKDVLVEEWILLDKLSDVKLCTLTRQDKILIKIYEKFYGEKPDFSSKDIEIKIQNMLYILSQYGVILLNNNGSCVQFSINENNLESNDIKKWVKELMPLGNNIKFVNDVELDDKTVKITQAVGNEIKKDLIEIERDKRTNTFREFCNIHYLKKNWYSKPNSVNALLQSQKIDSEDAISKHLQLIRRLDKEYEKNR